MNPSSKIMAAWATLLLAAILALTVVVSMSFADLDRPEYPIPVENR
jgi:hypothetical protein